MKFTQIQFYLMRTVQFSSLKTVNIDSDIFTQESPPTRSKLPLQLLKSIAQRKRVTKRNSNSRGDLYTFNLSKTRPITRNDQLKSQPSVNDFHQPVTAIEMFANKGHNKTNPQVGKGKSLTLTDANFMRPNQRFHSRNDSERQFMNPREKREKQNQKVYPQQIQNQYLHQNGGKINPYTHQPYSYITNKERDQLSEIKKATRFRRISSITKSYKVTTIQLAPPEHHRRPSVQYSPINMFSPTKGASQTKKRMAKREVDIVSPSPWQWGLQQSKDFLQ